MKKSGIDNDQASAAILVWFVVMIMILLFVWIGLSVATDRLTSFQNAFAAANPDIPVSQDRVNITTWMISGWASWVLFGIIIPVIWYSIIIAKRRQDGMV